MREAETYRRELLRWLRLALAAWPTSIGQSEFDVRLRADLPAHSARLRNFEKQLAEPLHGGGPKPPPDEEVKGILAKWQRARAWGTTQKGFCTTHGISVSTLERWEKKFPTS